MYRPLKLRVELTDRAKGGFPEIRHLDNSDSSRVSDDLAKSIREQFTKILHGDSAETEIQVASGNRICFRIANVHSRNDASGDFELHEIVAPPPQVHSEGTPHTPSNGFNKAQPSVSPTIPNSNDENCVVAMLKRVHHRAATRLTPSDYTILEEEFAELIAEAIEAPRVFELFAISSWLTLFAQQSRGDNKTYKAARRELVVAVLQKNWRALCQSTPESRSPHSEKGSSVQPSIGKWIIQWAARSWGCGQSIK